MGKYCTRIYKKIFVEIKNVKNFRANMNVRENEVETNAVLKSNGDVMLFKSVITDLACMLDMTYFPFDQVMQKN